MRAEVARGEVNPRIQAALRQLDAHAGIGEFAATEGFANTASLVNYGKVLPGAKKFDSATLTNAPPVR